MFERVPTEREREREKVVLPDTMAASVLLLSRNLKFMADR